MDSSFTQKSKSRKIKKLAKKSRVQIILDLFFREIQIIAVSVTVAKLCYQLVIMFEDSGVASIILANRSLAFVVGNAIVIALIAKSGVLLNQEVDRSCKRNNLYDEFVRESSRRDEFSRAEMRNRRKHSDAEKETQNIAKNISKQNNSDQTSKHIVAEKKMIQSKPEKLTKQSTSLKREKHSTVEHQEITVKKKEEHNLTEKTQSCYQRSRSENLKGSEKSFCERLRRSETDVSSEKFDSDDELRFKIESFIARQRRNQNDD